MTKNKIRPQVFSDQALVLAYERLDQLRFGDFSAAVWGVAMNVICTSMKIHRIHKHPNMSRNSEKSPCWGSMLNFDRWNMVSVCHLWINYIIRKMLQPVWTYRQRLWKNPSTIGVVPTHQRPQATHHEASYPIYHPIGMTNPKPPMSWQACIIWPTSKGA